MIRTMRICIHGGRDTRKCYLRGRVTCFAQLMIHRRVTEIVLLNFILCRNKLPTKTWNLWRTYIKPSYLQRCEIFDETKVVRNYRSSLSHLIYHLYTIYKYSLLFLMILYINIRVFIPVSQRIVFQWRTQVQGRRRSLRLWKTCRD